MVGLMKRATFPLAAGVVLVTVSIISGVTGGAQAAATNAQQETLRSVTTQVEEARQKAERVQTDTALQLSGASDERVAADTEIAEGLAERVLTWDSHESYSAARSSTMRAYGLAETDPFMTGFLPAAPVTRDSQGNEYPYIDAAGLNSRVAGSTVKLLSVDALKYSYMALVNVESKSSDGLGSSTSIATIFLTIDGEGKVSGLSGFASTTPPVSTR